MRVSSLFTCLLLVHCDISWHALPPPSVNQWNSVKSLTGVLIIKIQRKQGPAYKNIALLAVTNTGYLWQDESTTINHPGCVPSDIFHTCLVINGQKKSKFSVKAGSPLSLAMLKSMAGFKFLKQFAQLFFNLACFILQRLHLHCPH